MRVPENNRRVIDCRVDVILDVALQHTARFRVMPKNDAATHV